MEPINEVLVRQPEAKKSNSKTILIIIAVTIISALATGTAVWFIMTTQNNLDKTLLTTQIAEKTTTIVDLNKAINDSATSIVSLTPASDSTTAVNDITALKEFCLAGTTNVAIGNYFYASVTDGVYGNCDIYSLSGVGGYFKVAKKVNGAWTEVFSGQQISQSIITQYSIPSNVLISPSSFSMTVQPF